MEIDISLQLKIFRMKTVMGHLLAQEPWNTGVLASWLWLDKILKQQATEGRNALF